MNKIKKIFSIINYITILIPALVIVMALITSIFLIYSTKTFINQGPQGYIEVKSPVSFKEKLTPGIYRDCNNNTMLYTYSGKYLYISEKYYNVIKKYLNNHLSKESDSINYDNKELRDFINNAEAVYYYTNLYSEIILEIAKNFKEFYNVTSVENLAQEGINLADIDKLIINRHSQISTKYYDFKKTELIYKQNLVNYRKLFSHLSKNNDFKQDINQIYYNNQVNESYTNLLNSYINYRTATNKYKECINKNYIIIFDELNKRNASLNKFDITKTSLIQDNKIPTEAKELILRLSEEIKILNESIFNNKSKEYVKRTIIKLNANEIDEHLEEFPSVDITINFENSKTLNCIAECHYKNESECYKKCSNNKDY